jgi:hypothetical protein
MTTNAQDAAAVLEACAEKLALYRAAHSGEYVGGVEYTDLQARIAATVRTLRAGGEAAANSACPLCKAPSVRTVNPRGGEWGWGTTDEERATYRYAAPPAAPPARAGDAVAGLAGKWRDDAKRPPDAGLTVADAFNACADDLFAALNTPPADATKEK